MDNAISNFSELMRKAATGNKQAFETLVRQLELPIMNYLTRLAGSRTEAEDLFQETWLKVFENRKQYRFPDDPRPWIYRIAHNICVNHMKRTKTGQDKIIKLGQIDRQYEKPEHDMPELLQMLTAEQREALILRYYEQKSYDEIAKIMDAPSGTVGYWINQAIQALRDHLAKH